MARKINILVEGNSDKKFFEDFLKFLGYNEYTVDTFGGIGKKDKLLPKNKIKPIIDNNEICLVIVDADDNYSKRKQEIVDYQKINNLSFDFFIMPNNKDNGALENLLEHIINEKNMPVIDCWYAYENSLRNVNIEGREKPLTIPSQKTKMYVYLEELLGKSSSDKELVKDGKRDYLNTEHWNLRSSYLNPLKEFLSNHLP